MKIQSLNSLSLQNVSSKEKQNSGIPLCYTNIHTIDTLNDNPIAHLNRVNIVFGSKNSTPKDTEYYKDVLSKHLGFEAEIDEDGLLTIPYFCQPDENTTFADLGIDENDMFKHIRKIKENAYFENCKATSLGSITEIEGDADFSYSSIETLGNLETIGRNADFQCSVVSSLGKLKTIGNNAIFASSQITDLQNLESIGGDADFRDTQIESFGKLKEIMRHVYINSDDIEDKLKDVLICGDVINDEMDYLED